MDKYKEIPKEVYDAMMVLDNFCNSGHDCNENCPLYCGRYDDCRLGWVNPNAYHKHIFSLKDGKYYIDEEEQT